MKKTTSIKTGKFGPNMSAMDTMNNPFRAAYWGGHELNESYKMPAPNASGTNHSYMHPANVAGGGSNTKKLDAKQNRVAGPVRQGKNTY